MIKKIFVSIMIVVAMVIGVAVMGSEKAFAATSYEEGSTIAEQTLNDEMDAFCQWAESFVIKEYGWDVLDNSYSVYGNTVVWSLTVCSDDGIESESEVLTANDVHSAYDWVCSWQETERLSDWM